MLCLSSLFIIHTHTHHTHIQSTLKNALKTAHKRRRFEADKYIARNTLFLAEVNELREANRRLEQKCKKYMSLALGKGYTPSQLTDSATSKGDESGSAQGVRGSIECRRNEEKVSSYAESTNINGNSDGGLGAAGFVDSGRLHSAASQRSISSAGSSRFSRSGMSTCTVGYRSRI